MSMSKINTQLIYQAVYEMALHSVCNVDTDTVDQLITAQLNETNAVSAFALKAIIDNDKLAAIKNIPACQDTGMAVVFIELGQQVCLIGSSLSQQINSAVANAYRDGYFRASVLDPITRLNTKDNTPAIIHTDIVDGDSVTVHFLAKGFGSENMSRLYMLTPSAGTEGIIKAVVETVSTAGANPCPPIIVGVGIGGTMEKACLLAKKSLLRRSGVSSSNEQIAALEKEILKQINNTNIGACGFGGNNTALQVNIETFPTHIAALPVAVNIQCHCVRHSTRVIKET